MAEDEKIYLGSKDQITEIGDTDTFIIATNDGIRRMTKAQVMEKLGINQLTKELGEAISQLSEDIEGIKKNGTGGTSTGTGWTDEAKTALLNCFKYVAWTISNGQDYYNALETALNSSGSSGDDNENDSESGEDTEATLTSILATYTGGSVAVGTALTSLTGITVKATYSDGSTKTVTGYVLSGTIAEGSNTITVSYGGKTTTFTVVGYVETSGDDSGEEETETTEAVYTLAEATTFDDTNYVDTGYILNDDDKDWSILIEFEPASVTGQLFDSSKNANLYGPHMRSTNSTDYSLIVGNTSETILFSSYLNKTKLVITHEKGSGEFKTYHINEKIAYMIENLLTYSAYATNSHTIGNTNTLKLGSKYTGDTNYFVGTIHQFEIYERVLTSEEVEAFIDATWVEPNEVTNLIDIDTCTLGGNMEDGRTVTEEYYVTDFIPVANGYPYYTNITIYIDDSTANYSQYIYMYNSEKSWLKVYRISNSLSMGTDYDITQFCVASENCSYVRLVFHTNYKDIAFFGEGMV